MTTTSRVLSFLALTLTTVLAAALLAPAPATAVPKKGWGSKPSDYLAAPNFPDSTLKIKVQGKPKPGDRVKVKLSGYNAGGPISPGSEVTYSFDVSLYVTVPSVLRSCPASFDEMRTIFINNSDVSGSIVSDLYVGEGGTFSKTIPYRSGRAKKVLFCAYTRWIIDDVAVSGYRYKFTGRR
jgi:hypothetical protein